MSSNTEQILLWLDCDPGHDDALAIILAAFNSHVKFLGISTASGNQTAAKTTANAISILESIGKKHDIPVVMGASKPLLRKRQNSPEIHGESGLDGTSLLPKCDKVLYAKAQERKAIDVMAQTILAQDRKVVLVATGAMTNIALLVSVYPEVVEKVEMFTFMGGASFGPGNVSATAEFNIYIDPEAAQICMQAGFQHVAMIPLDVTHTVLVTDNIIDRIRREVGEKNKTFAQMICELMVFFRDTYERVFDFHDGPPLHDPLAVFYAITHKQNKLAFKEKLMRVDVECGNGLCVGQTVCDIWGNSSTEEKNCYVTLSVDVDKFWDSMIEALVSGGASSPLDS
ncbi:Inosine-uridine-preferring nucleoside hydrolase-like protein [Zancudomyces culisetae]|uniref:Inosine-uridine-preferring nucleoside hydrolase-like protein n=1 Tax=Zancudomyces culisetae TaxID=1213189 RepID=A0A1R1PYA6_ZANCU|nr:Inosine-uridine-preferring nucleoside hydrolase-like protein [Zancudomyces culisetae]|eukprot:OMH85897.1 Inosine-uridine-preferring nucleoside hydrolase-like protein [Zancudomyces culisetae]